MKLEFKILENRYTTVKQVLKEHFEISDRLLLKLKKNQRIFLNNEKVFINKLVNINDTILVNLDFEEENENIVATKMDLDILYEDDAMLILNKPFNCSGHPFIANLEDSL